jgi:hypothetical protein
MSFISLHLVVLGFISYLHLIILGVHVALHLALCAFHRPHIALHLAFSSRLDDPFISPFISPFIFPISSAKERELNPTRHIPAMSDSMIFFIEDLLVNIVRNK